MENDDTPQLSSETLQALYEFYNERSQKLTYLNRDINEIEENWQLSQFWYDDETANILANEAVKLSGENGRIVCISCPTVYKKLHSLNKEIKLCLLEYDKRFSIFGDDFIFYDYKNPLNLDDSLKQAFDVVLADPPYLSEECLSNVAKTIKFLARDKIILCTGAIMEDLACKLLDVRPSSLKINHQKQLGNEFKCFVNYNSLTEK